MSIKINKNGIWYHGSDTLFETLRVGSTITQWKELAEAFSHRPTALSYDDNGMIEHNGKAHGYLYIIDEPIEVGIDIIQHPNTSMDLNAEFITQRALKVKLVTDL